MEDKKVEMPLEDEYSKVIDNQLRLKSLLQKSRGNYEVDYKEYRASLVGSISK